MKARGAKAVGVSDLTWRELELLPEIAEGVAYVDGVRVKRREEAPKKKAAA